MGECSLKPNQHDFRFVSDHNSIFLRAFPQQQIQDSIHMKVALIRILVVLGLFHLSFLGFYYVLMVIIASYNCISLLLVLWRVYGIRSAGRFSFVSYHRGDVSLL